MERCLLICLASVAVLQGVLGKTKLESLVTRCSRSDPRLNECVKKAVVDILPAFGKGIRDFNLVPINPLKVPFIELSQSDRPIGLKLNITNTVHDGLVDTQVKAVRIDLKKLHWELDLLVPRYILTGDCDVGGRILLLPITGHGPCNLTSVAHDLNLVMDSKLEQKNGKEYLKFKKFQAKLKFRKGHFRLEGLFGGNKELGETMNRFLNENGVDVLKEMKPTLEAVWTSIFGSLLQNVFSSIPYSELFKD